MVSPPATTSARAGRQVPSVAPVVDSSCTSQLNHDPSAARRWGRVRTFMRLAATRSATATATMTTPQAMLASETSSTGSKHRTAPRRARVPALVGLLVVAACSSGGAATPTTTAAPPTTVRATTTAPSTAAPTTLATTILRPPPVTLPVPTVVTVAVPRPAVPPAPPPEQQGGGTPAGGNASEGYGPFGPFTVQPLDDAARAAVTAAVEAYLVAGSVLPLRSGAPADLRAVLTPSALARLNPAQLAVLTDGAESGLTALEAVALARAEVGVDGIVGPDGGSVAAATIDTLVTATTAGGSPVRISRRGNLLLVPGPSGWQIDEFDLVVDRELP